MPMSISIKSFLITLSISNIENPPTKSADADADPEIWCASLSEALTETDINGLVSFDFGTERSKCSGE